MPSTTPKKHRRPGAHPAAKGTETEIGRTRRARRINRTLALKTGTGAPGEPDMLATHPGTAERINQVTRAARRIGALP